jgi:hypothetical protein
MKKPVFAMIAWIDAECAASWQDEPALAKYQLPVVHHVGWLVSRGKDRISLAQGISGGQFCNVIHIPIGMVKKFKKLADPR